CNGAWLDEGPGRGATRRRILRQGDMQPSIRERLDLVAAPYPTAESRCDAAVMARSMMYLFAAGAAVPFASLLISPPGTGLPRIAATGACALALSGLVLLGVDRIPVRGLQA